MSENLQLSRLATAHVQLVNVIDDNLVGVSIVEVGVDIIVENVTKRDGLVGVGGVGVLGSGEADNVRRLRSGGRWIRG